MPLERTIVASITRRAQAAGWWVTKLHGGPMQRAGLPDLLCLKDGRACFLEVKQPGKDATPLQKHRMQEIARGGGVPCYVVHSAEEAEAALSAPLRRATDPRASSCERRAVGC